MSIFMLTYLAYDRFLIVVQSKTAQILRKSWFFTNGQSTVLFDLLNWYRSWSFKFLQIVFILWCAGILLSFEPIRRAKISGDGQCGIDWGRKYDCVENRTGILLDNEGYCACDISMSHAIFQVVAFFFSYACPLLILLLSYYSIVREVHRVEVRSHRHKLETTL